MNTCACHRKGNSEQQGATLAVDSGKLEPKKQLLSKSNVEIGLAVIMCVVAIFQCFVANEQAAISDKQATITQEQNKIALFEKRYELYEYWWKMQAKAKAMSEEYIESLKERLLMYESAKNDSAYHYAFYFVLNDNIENINYEELIKNGVGGKKMNFLQAKFIEKAVKIQLLFPLSSNTQEELKKIANDMNSFQIPKDRNKQLEMQASSEIKIKNLLKVLSNSEIEKELKEEVNFSKNFAK